LTISSSNRFRKDNRLLDAAAFGRVFDRARRSRDNLFTVLCRQNETATARLGLAISKKHCRRATARNRIKRAIRESFRQQQDLLSGLDVVVMNNPAAATASNVEMFVSLDRHWMRCSRTKAEGPKDNG
jgi:ribonuclease P protein component